MRNVLKNLACAKGFSIIIVSAFLLSLSAYSTAQVEKAVQQSGQQNLSAASECKENASEKKLYCVSLKSKIDPPPINRIHSWVLHLVDTTGKPVEKANILVYGGMPAHKHGFPTNPQVTESLGNGDFLIEGVKFSMHGEWEMWLTITTDTGSDKAVFKISVS